MVPTRDDDLDWSGAGMVGGKGEDKVKGKGKEREKEEEVLNISSPAVSATDKETARLRSVLHANVGACLLKMVRESISPCALVKIDLGARAITRKLRRRVLKVCLIVRSMGVSTLLSTPALLDDPAYVKARERRVACNEVIGSWTSLTSVQEGASLLPKASDLTIRLTD